ncbi:MBL fold metallo-hydrolase [Spongiimicrobium salis]|uniref:MBL fold metallo-hydrolase n=1 Tax=Spongiimicrobium salis TaxID=1667022 RepID=UPI00374CC4C8
MSRTNTPLMLLLMLLYAFSMKAQEAKIEYIAHASFLIESDQGTKVLLDPYHSYNQMGYTFPDNVTTDFVLITHPHFDHDASKYLGEHTPVFREAGTYQFKDIQFKGIPSNHAGAERMKDSGNQLYNIIWVVTVGTTKIAHLGDNEVLTPAEVALLDGVDYIIGPANDAYYELFKKATYIPNHYLLPEITKHTNWMKPVDDWLQDKKEVKRLDSNTLELGGKGVKSGILVFQPSKDVKEWSREYYEALALLNEGFAAYRASKKPEDGLPAMEKLIISAPHVVDGYLYKASFLFPSKDFSGVIETLEKGFANVPDMDWGTEARMHGMLADAYMETDQKKRAYKHYLWIVRHDHMANTKTIQTAKTFIAKHFPKGL